VFLFVKSSQNEKGSIFLEWGLWGLTEQSYKTHLNFLKGQCHRFFASDFFHESSSPKPLKITLRSFQYFSKIRGDICNSRCTTGINDTGGNSATGVNNTGGKQWEQYQISDNIK
jgi:hypothetical protein